ncbi:hypothetical protein Gasu_63220 isoform 2 [Galdieria sulphuraria]|nr:hypothetical protein Gasu_63220 isoform 2 [Galdieria sulphuraria]EME26021.1 hypothetical protein Gasu_63220 isoform 2 [Galdieria sulphuraria]|eukprot:XP_005702541.1 hypothetical protein isoform 2 [Galdieria sulphuraria]
MSQNVYVPKQGNNDSHASGNHEQHSDWNAPIWNDDEEHSQTKNRVEMIYERSKNVIPVGKQSRSFPWYEQIIDPSDRHLKEDIIRLIVQYLQEEDYLYSAAALQDEANVKHKDVLAQQAHLQRVKTAILEGDWAEVEKLCSQATFKNLKSFLYEVYKQQYLELVDRQEYQKAFVLLQKRLKSLEGYAQRLEEFHDLCYLLTCKSVNEAKSFRDWNGTMAGREALVEQFQRLLDFEVTDTSAPVQVPPSRLVQLLQQAVAYQIEFSRYHPKAAPRIKTLLEDYHCFVLPNREKQCFVGHQSNVKCVQFVGESGAHLVSGSSDNTLILWDTESGEKVASFIGHTSRIWDIDVTRGGFIASASGDGTVRIWDAKSDIRSSCRTVISGHTRDVYTVSYHPRENHLVTGGYDKSLRLVDVRTGQTIKTFTGHEASISKAVFNPHGNLIISGSKDSTIKFWDVISGVCVKTLSSHLGEVTAVETNASGSLLLSSSKDNSNRLWDIRMARPTRRFKGHQNTSKNFIRVGFGTNEELVVGGSEDGFVYIWDTETGNLVQKLGPCVGPIYAAQWCNRQSLLASCGHDGMVRTWWFDPSTPLTDDDK